MRTPTFLFSMCILVCASGCSFIDDFGSFTVAAGDAGTADLGPDALLPDLGDRDAGGPDAGPIGSVVELGAGSGYTCALFSSGRLRCWGGNFAGVLGNGDISGPPGVDQAMPQDVIGLPGRVVQLAAGRDHACALVDEDGTNVLFCWGSSYDGQFGNGGSEAYVSTPTRIDTVWEPQAVAGGGKFTCVITEDDEVACTGDNADRQLGRPNPPSSSTTFVEIATSLGSSFPTSIVAGWNNACVIVDGNEQCWGSGDSTQLTRPTTDDSADPVDVGPWAQIAIGASHMCGIATGGALRCWGYGAWGQLGNGADVDASMPVDVMRPVVAATPLAAVAVAAAEHHTCAIFDDPSGVDDVYCWGLNDEGELGVPAVALDDFLLIPTRVAGIADVVRLTTGDDHVCALTRTGDVYCWGSNYYRELGPEFVGDNSATPVRITGLD